MANINVKLDTKQLKAFRDQLQQKASEEQTQKFFESCAKELAARLLAKVIKRTPVGQYPAGSGKNDGTLRRGWTGGVDGNAAQYAQSLQVERVDGGYQIEITNPVAYASYVEYGHRQTVGRFVPAIGKRLKQNWIEGKFMLTISEKELQAAAPGVIEKKMEKFLKECFG